MAFNVELTANVISVWTGWGGDWASLGGKNISTVMLRKLEHGSSFFSFFKVIFIYLFIHLVLKLSFRWRCWSTSTFNLRLVGSLTCLRFRKHFCRNDNLHTYGWLLWQTKLPLLKRGKTKKVHRCKFDRLVSLIASLFVTRSSNQIKSQLLSLLQDQVIR